nr:putative ribonuclease H-like domain-containing protein [Tanacetum cinerariifolium]
MESVRTATTPYEVPKHKSKDEPDEAVIVHLYRSMIGSLMYLIASRPDIMFALKAYSDSDYAGSHGDRKSTTGGCQFLGRRLILWQCKKQTVVATYSTEAEYVAAASCCGQFPFVYEQKPSYNQNYDGNYYSHDLPSFPCCDYCGGSHENHQCQPMDHNIDFSGSDQIQTPQYPDVHENPLTKNEFEAFMKANDDKINNLKTEFDHFQKKCEQMQDDLLNQMRNFIQNFQNGPPGEDKEHEATTKTELFSNEDIQPLQVQEPPQNSDMYQIIEECCVEASEEQKQKMEDTMLDLEQEIKNVEEQPAERRNRAEKSLKNFRVIHKSSISLNSSQISSIHSVAPILSTKEPENSLSMGYEHLSITPETESDEVTKSNAENLLPIPSEGEVTLEDKRERDELICENSSTIDVCDNHSEILFDSNNDDFSSDDESFEDIEYVDASVPDPAIVSVEEENVVHREEVEVDLEEISQVQDVVLREKLLSITRLISNIESLNDNSTPDRVLNSFEFDNSLLDNFSPEFETFFDHSEETRSGNTTHANYSLPEYDSFCFEIEPDQERLINLMKNDVPENSSNDPLLEEADLFLSDDSIPPGIENVANDPEGDVRFLEELLIDDSIIFHELSDDNFKDNPSNLRPPPEPPDDNFDLEPEVISAVMEDIDEPDEHFDPGREINVSTKIEDDDYFPFMFVFRFFLPYFIFHEISPLLLSAESEDTIFDPGIFD